MNRAKRFRLLSIIEDDNLRKFENQLKRFDTNIDREFSSRQYGELNCADGTPLWYAVYFGSINIVKYLIEQGANVNFSNGAPMIYIAADNYEITKLLLEAGADPNINFQYLNPIFKTVKECNIKVFDILRKYGAAVNIEFPDGNIISLATNNVIEARCYETWADNLDKAERMFRHILSDYTIFHSLDKTKALKYAEVHGDKEIISLLEFQSLKFIAYGSMVKNSIDRDVLVKINII